MLIAGFQPLSLLDYPGTPCSIVFTQGCPFRCVYCHNPELIPLKPTANVIPEAEVFEKIAKRQKMVEGVCITGGEPTIHPDLPEFVRRLKEAGLLVKLDTNGLHPRMVSELIAARLVDFIAMDLKHKWSRYGEVTSVAQPNVIANCQETFRLIQESNVPHEFRTTVYPALHSVDDLMAIAEQLRQGERYALQEIRYQKTLVPGLMQAPPLDLTAVAEKIKAVFSSLAIEVRM